MTVTNIVRFGIADSINATHSGAYPFFMNAVGALRAQVPHSDLSDAAAFHSWLWLIVQHGGSQQFISDDLCVSPAEVSRWLKGKKTPGIARRRGILESALLSLERAIENRSVIPLSFSVKSNRGGRTRSEFRVA